MVSVTYKLFELDEEEAATWQQQYDAAKPEDKTKIKAPFVNEKEKVITPIIYVEEDIKLSKLIKFKLLIVKL